jgi:CHAT domain-containing protein
LIQPVEQELQKSERVVISPDGILHSLPFSALAKKQHSEEGGLTWKYLIEDKPVHSIVSATVYAEILKTRRKEAKSTDILVALGDPQYPRTGSKDTANTARSPSIVARDYKLEPLPSSRTEVEEITRIFPGNATPLLGLDATEENVKALSQKANYLHFACHGILDERSSLDSALALTIPAQQEAANENGFLQACGNIRKRSYGSRARGTFRLR